MAPVVDGENSGGGQCGISAGSGGVVVTVMKTGVMVLSR